VSSSTSTEPAFTRDALLAGKVALWQPTRGYRVAVDPVLLAAAVEPKAGDRVLDMGCGVAAISLCLLARCPDISVVGLERNVDLRRALKFFRDQLQSRRRPLRPAASIGCS
jgi:tRNA1(Val) A37 N6-methylase TrmN6